MKKFVLVLALALFPSIWNFAFAYGAGEGNSMGPWMMNWGYSMGWCWMIIMAVFWISVIVGIVFLIRWIILSTNKGRETKPEDSAIEILKRRYAKGEINKEEFEEKKKDLI